MSAGFFGSFFKRQDLHSDGSNAPGPNTKPDADPHEAASTSVAPNEVKHMADQANHSFDAEGGQSRGGDHRASSARSVDRSRLGWLVGFADDEDDQPGVGLANSVTPDRDSAEGGFVAPLDPVEDEYGIGTDDLSFEPEPEYSADDLGADDSFDFGFGYEPEHEDEEDAYTFEGPVSDLLPTEPEAAVREVDQINTADESSLSGDGYSEESYAETDEWKEELPSLLDSADELEIDEWEAEEPADAVTELPTFDPPVEDPEAVADDEIIADPVDALEVAGEDVDAVEDAVEPEVEPERKPEPIVDVPVDDALISELLRKDRVVAMLVRKEVVTHQHVANAQHLREGKATKEALWRVLASLPNVDTEVVYAEAARVYAFKVAELGDGMPDVEFARSVMETFPEDKRERLLKQLVLPFQAAVENRTGAIKLIFITHDPTRPELHKLMQDLRLERFELRYAPESLVRAFLAEAFPKKNEFLERMSDGNMRYDLGAAFDEDSRLIDDEALEAEISRSSLINLFEATLVEAVRRGASDIHIYPNAQKHIEVHFRVDGRLGRWHVEEKVHPEALLAVIKDNAMNVDRFERDSAQDGFIQRWIDDALIRFRVSVLPIANATQELRSESIVIRVLDDRKVITDLEKLGLLNTAKQRFEMAISQPHGMVILTGPTGSGKSTTLVAAMHQVVTPEVNVLTVEDPVEYIIPGVRQIKLNHKLGLEEALRAILRHDPDVVMVGEMRDKQTADLAIKLANTGHLTFSTLHTNDAPSAVSRLYKMGIEPFLIAYAINMVVAQRLIRTLCPDCKQVDTDPDEIMLKKLGFTESDLKRTIYKTGSNPKCKSCKGTAYKGRRAVTEALYFSRPIRHLIVEAQNMIDEEAIRKLAVKEGMLTLRDSAREIVKMGETSVTEMIRVVTTDS